MRLSGLIAPNPTSPASLLHGTQDHKSHPRTDQQSIAARDLALGLYALPEQIGNSDVDGWLTCLFWRIPSAYGGNFRMSVRWLVLVALSARNPAVSAIEFELGRAHADAGGAPDDER